MAAFAKSSFNTSVYAASRPTYPAQLFDYIFKYHRLQSARMEHAVDLGCGTGQATAPLRGRFKRVSCIDPSTGMLEKAKTYLAAPTTVQTPQISSFSFHQASAEDLAKTVPHESVDLLIAAQACHWFDWAKVWPATQDTLRRGGTAAFWVYGEFRLPEYPTLNAQISEYSQGTDPNSKTSVGTYFQRPGRTTLERLLVDVPSPKEVLGESNLLTDFRRVYFSGSDPIPHPHPRASLGDTFGSETEVHPVIMQTSWTWLQLLGYLRTWSALHAFHERYPEDLATDDDERFLPEDLKAARSIFIDDQNIKGGDVSVRFWKNLREEARKTKSTAGVGLLDKVAVEWPLSLLISRKL